MFQTAVILMKQNIFPALQCLADNLEAHGVRVVRAGRADTADLLPTDEISGYGSCLYITDDETVYRELKERGRYVLPCRHDRNRDADFADAPYVIEQIEELGYEEIDMAYRRLAGLPWEILTTKRCIIRETVEADIDSFYRIYAEPDITAYMEDLYADRDEELAYIRDYREKVYGFYGYGMWTVLTKDGDVIGRAGISWREGFDLPELGFVIGVPWQRQGYAYEVCSAIIGYAGRELGMRKLQALVMEGNGKSECLCVKLGFQYVRDAAIDGGRYRQFVRDI